MYKCLSCGHIFEEGEMQHWRESHGFNDGFYEEFSGCPMCGGDYEETIECKECGAHKLEDAIFGGFCVSCLREAVTMETGIQYLCDREWIVEFVFGELFKIDTPKKSNAKLVEWCEFIAQESASIEQLVAYIVDTGREETEDFANWLNAKEV